ncbi:hypothetical protein ACQZ4Q_09490 [Agrobacterium vitis]
MRISASYNFFNGDEHLISSLKLMRECVDHISIVWQKISNAGEPISSCAINALHSANELNLADEIVFYEPNLDLPRNKNEVSKRQIGLDIARKAGATHFLTLDADEFYRPAEFSDAKKLIKKHGWKSTSVPTFLHLKSPVWRAPDVTCCCFITEISDATEMGVEYFPQENIDPTRRMTASAADHHHFAANVVAMYHMNLVRRDLNQKLRNSTTTNTEFLNLVAEAVDRWRPGAPFEFPNKGKLNLSFVENEFNTYEPEV